MHISVIGDSLTKGVILSEGKYQELEEGFVNIVSREKGLALKNFSKFGSTVRYGHSVLTRHSAEISESEYTIIEFGGNDSDFIWDVVASEPIMLSLAPIIGKRYFSALIVLLVIPSIWSAVILIRQNNFEADATAFVEHRKTYGNSILYDYKISFKDEVMEAAGGYGSAEDQA